MKKGIVYAIYENNPIRRPDIKLPKAPVPAVAKHSARKSASAIRITGSARIKPTTSLG